jgi:hypothetical protein
MDVSTPVLVVRLKLPKRYSVRVCVWDSLKELQANTPEESDKDYAAIFLPAHDKSRCIGTIHLSADDIRNGTRAHEISHAIDEYVGRLINEQRAQAVETLTNDLDAALLGLGG